jgi:hypothetical protein
MSPQSSKRTIKGKRPEGFLTTVDPRGAGARTGRASEDVAIDSAEIALLAYSYWEARRGQHGSAEEDWLRAEQELRARQTSGRR